MIQNNYLFSSRFLDYLKSQKIKDKDQFNGFSQTIKSLFKHVKGNDIQSLSQNISNVLYSLQFSLAGFEFANVRQTAKYAYLYDGFPLTNKVSCIYLIPSQKDINATLKGNFPAFDLIHLLKQEKLEWGILTNGKIWRLYSTLTAQPYEDYLEIDFSDDHKDNYKVFWQLFSLNLFLPDENDVTPLETYIEESEKEAEVIEKHIQKNIDNVLEDISYGFLKFNKKHDQPLSEEDRDKYFRNSVFLLFRMLFIFYAESRQLLPVKNPEYQQHSLDALLEQARKQHNDGIAHLDGIDLWDKFRDLCDFIDQGYEQVGIPEYDGGLFDGQEHQFLSENKLSNEYFIRILYNLGYYTKRKTEHKIQYQDISVRSLGSLYEGILEYKLFIAEQDLIMRKKKIIPREKAGKIKRSDREIPKGHVYFSQAADERHDTGSYYTPEDVVNYMVQNSVRLGLEERWIDFLPTAKKYETEIKKAVHEDIKNGLLNKFDKELQNFVQTQILTFKVIDPAMGSGHFLVNTLNTITHFILEVLQANVIISNGPIKHEKTPIEIEFSIFEHQHQKIDLNPADWRRKVVEKCIFGIDINPLATELAKLSLWIASTAAGKPLTFLNHHLKCGDSIMGIRLTDMMTYPKKETKKDDQTNLFDKIDKDKIDEIRQKYKHFLEQSTEEIQDVTRKKDEYKEIEQNAFLNHLKDVATLWLMISYEIHGKKSKSLFDSSLETQIDPETYFDLLNNAQTTTDIQWQNRLDESLYNTIKEYQHKNNIFHWELEFPEIINNGFEAVVGNPPYVDVKTEDYIGVPLESLKSRNLYAYIPERGFNYLKKNYYLSFITPMAVICSKSYYRKIQLVFLLIV